MHMWNWITGVRAGAHISISSSTELKFYHLLVFKAKNIQLTLQGKKSRQSIFFTGRAGLQLPCPTHTAELSAWSSWRVRRKWNAHVSIPLSWTSSLAKLLFLLQPRTIPGPEVSQGGGYLLYLSSDKLYNKVMLPEESFWKENAAHSFHTKVQSSDTRAKD